MERASLYERLGGEDGIERLITRLYEKVLADPVLAPMFAKSSVDRVMAMQRKYIAVAVGGPEAYSGRSLSEVHAGRGISTRHFYLFARKLLEALEELGASPDDAYDVANRLARNVGDVTGGPSYLG
jgi:hemoglobin